jgi:hypothetical protein
MFDDLKYTIEKSGLPNSFKLALSVFIKAIGWFAWAFVIIGTLLDSKYFPYWLAFFMVVEGVLFGALIYVLVLAARSSVTNKTTEEISTTNNTQNGSQSPVMKSALHGIVGNIAFYFFIIAVFVLLKSMGVFDAFLDTVYQKLN